MNPMVSAALGSIIRALLFVAAGWLVRHGVWTQADATTYVEAATLALIGLGWSLWQKYKGRLRFLAALEATPGTTEEQVHERVAAGVAPSAGAR